jgi:hypothetical protein
VSVALLAARETAAAGPDDVCRGPAPGGGAVVKGPVLVVPDGSTLCVALGLPPSDWVVVKLPDLGYSRSVLMAAAFGKNAICTVRRGGFADCRIQGKPLNDVLRRPEVQKAAEEWR